MAFDKAAYNPFNEGTPTEGLLSSIEDKDAVRNSILVQVRGTDV